LAERDRIEAGRRLPEGLARDLARAGFFRIFLPAAYGGLDLTPLEAIDVYEEVARADASGAWGVLDGDGHWTNARLPEEVGLEIFSDPTMILANSTRPTGRATVAEGGYRVNGRWSLVSGCQLSAWFILMCTVYEDSKPRLTSSRAPEYRFMLCPVSDCKILDTWTVSGLRGTGSHDVVVEECFVPARYASFYTDPLVLTGARYEIPAHSRVARMPIANVNGCGFYYEQSGKGRALVFIHGEIQGMEYWDQQVAEFSKDYRCTIYNRRGHVKTQWTDYGFSLVNQTRDLELLTEKL